MSKRTTISPRLHQTLTRPHFLDFSLIFGDGHLSIVCAGCIQIGLRSKIVNIFFHILFTIYTHSRHKECCPRCRPDANGDFPPLISDHKNGDVVCTKYVILAALRNTYCMVSFFKLVLLYQPHTLRIRHTSLNLTANRRYLPTHLPSRAMFRRLPCHL